MMSSKSADLNETGMSWPSREVAERGVAGRCDGQRFIRIAGCVRSDHMRRVLKTLPVARFPTPSSRQLPLNARLQHLAYRMKKEIKREGTLARIRRIEIAMRDLKTTASSRLRLLV